MKLSHIRTASWGLAVVGAGVSCALTFLVVRDGRSLQAGTVKAWEPVAPKELSDLAGAKRLGDEQVHKAFANLYPPPPVIVPTTPASVPPPVDPEPKLNLKLLLVTMERGKGAVPMAFIEQSVPGGASSVFVVGEEVFDTGAVLQEIREKSVILRRKNGKTVELKVESSDGGTDVPTGAVGVVVGAQPLPPAAEQPPAPVPGPPPAPGAAQGLDKVKYRLVPKTRAVVRDEDYGLDIVQYDKDDKDVLRFALSEKDKQNLEKNQLRLMSEVAGEVAVDEAGKVLGIRAAFLKDAPLLSKFGVQQGDILTRIDEVPITSFEQVMKIYNEMTPKRRVKCDLLREIRDGANLTRLPIVLFFEMDDFPDLKETPQQPQ